MNVIEPTEGMRQEWTEWLMGRPEYVRAVAEKFCPWKLYRMKSTGHRALLVCFDEHSDQSVTLRVFVSAKYNVVLFERGVFGINPNDLEECNLPDPDERVGAAMGAREAREHIARGRPN